MTLSAEQAHRWRRLQRLRAHGPGDLRELVVQQRGLWELDRWRDEPVHRLLVPRARAAGVAGSQKAIHDACLWAWILTRLGCRATMPGAIAELLPGTSTTIPLALSAIGHNGALVRVDATQPAPVPAALGIATDDVHADLFAWTVPPGVTTIVGNHVIDDLMLWLWEPDAGRRAELTDDVVLGRACWAEIARPATLAWLAVRISACLRRLCLSLPPGGTLILRQYPCATAIYSHDRARIAAEARVYADLRRRLAATPGLRVATPDLTALPLPAAGRLAGSVLHVAAVGP